MEYYIVSRGIRNKMKQKISTIAFLLLISVLLLNPVSADLTQAQSIPSNGVVRYSYEVVRIALDGWGVIPTQELVDKLECEWAFQPAMYYGTGDPDTAEEEWEWCPGKQYIDLGITNLIGEYSGLEHDHDHWMLCLRNQLALSLNHPEIVGIYLNDYYFSLRDGYRTRAQWEEVVDTIRSVNPNLPLVVGWVPWMEDDENIDTWLSWIEYDQVLCQMRLGQSLPLEGMDAFMTRCEIKFAGKPIWGTANIHDQNQVLLTEQEFKEILNINKNHWDSGKIIGVRIQHVQHLLDHPEYADWTREILIENP